MLDRGIDGDCGDGGSGEGDLGGGGVGGGEQGDGVGVDVDGEVVGGGEFDEVHPMAAFVLLGVRCWLWVWAAVSLTREFLPHNDLHACVYDAAGSVSDARQLEVRIPRHYKHA